MLPYLFILYTVLIVCENKEVSIEVCSKRCDFSLSINCTEINAVPTGRCCMNGNSYSSVVGLDLSSCHITSIENYFNNLDNLEVLFLQNNSIQVPKIEAFHGLTKLKLLKLPPKLNCPGGNELWNKTEQTSEVVTCINELSTCTVYNVSCPNQNSYCVDRGPQVTECLCKPGYHGYKCLRKGTFPVTAFVIGLGVSTVVVSAILWFTQRRKIKKQ